MLAIFLFVATASCAHAPQSPRALSVDAIIRGSDNLEGKIVTLNGFLRFGDDSHNIWSDQKTLSYVENSVFYSRDPIWSRCITLFEIDGFRTNLLYLDRRYVTITGVLHRAVPVADDVNLGSCSSLGISPRSIKPTAQ
jgi:hypothetical protein